jgi:predicted AAA+ superfamily ATPase
MGARQTGKSTLLRILFPDCPYYDLLKGEEFERFNRRPELLREELQLVENDSLIIIDEVQKIPKLLDEVHWLIVHENLRFILCGSSARKLKRSGANLLGGRAVRNTLFPLNVV